MCKMPKKKREPEALEEDRKVMKGINVQKDKDVEEAQHMENKIEIWEQKRPKLWRRIQIW